MAPASWAASNAESCCVDLLKRTRDMISSCGKVGVDDSVISGLVALPFTPIDAVTSVLRTSPAMSMIGTTSPDEVDAAARERQALTQQFDGAAAQIEAAVDRRTIDGAARFHLAAELGRDALAADVHALRRAYGDVEHEGQRRLRLVFALRLPAEGSRRCRRVRCGARRGSD